MDTFLFAFRFALGWSCAGAPLELLHAILGLGSPASGWNVARLPDWRLPPLHY